MITVYTTPRCVQCKPTKATLTRADVPFLEIDVSLPENAAKAAEFKQKGYLQAPILVTDDGEEWSGFNPYLLAAYIERTKAVSE